MTKQRGSCRVLCVLLAALLSLSSVPARAEYRLAPGDTLDISVLGLPGLQRRALVEPDGTISFPLLGTLQVSGQTLAKVRAAVKAGLASKVYRQRESGSVERAFVIGIDEITVVVAGYRPIYVKGGVAAAGEYTFRPAMTVREAIAVSGGYDLVTAGRGNAYLDAVDFRGEYDALWVRFVTQQARVWRLKAELDDRDLDPEIIARKIPAEATISRDLVGQIVALAISQHEVRRVEYERQEKFLKQSIVQMDERIQTMSRRKAQAEKGAANEAKDLERLAGLYESRSLVHSSLVEARRNVLFSATRVLETTSELMRLEQGKADLVQELNQLVDKRRISGLIELEAATVRLGEIGARLESVGEKMRMAEMAEGFLGDIKRTKPVIKVYRKDESGWQANLVDEAFELYPGDVVEILFEKRPAAFAVFPN